MKHIRAIFTLGFWLYIATLIFLCLYSFKDTGVELPGLLWGIETDKYIHFLMFFPFSFASWFAFGKNLEYKYHYKIFIYILLFGLILSTGLEFSQRLTYYRDFDLFDLLANYLGLLSGLILIFSITKLKKFRKHF